MTRDYGVCPNCFGANIEALAGVLRRCRDCGKHFGQSRRKGQRSYPWTRGVLFRTPLRGARQGA